jgi:hypothetical protein
MSVDHKVQKHASVSLYLVFAVVLTTITFVEWVLFKVESIRSQTIILVPSLIALSIIKFIMVTGWYMHLRYDHSVLRKLFAFSLCLAFLIFTILTLALH